MFFDLPLLGDGLPPGTLCFTYDDGPGRTEGDPEESGPRTAELGAFLRAEGVPATFFAVGKFACEHGDILARLRSLGHLVANHTFDHPSLPGFVARGGDARAQLARTQQVIDDHVEARPTLFRAPYGDWTLRGRQRSNVAADLNASALAATHVGPVGWDIDAGDVGFWRDDRPAQECAGAYLEAIERAGRGIVLMHDSTADIDEIRPRNRALGLARALLPVLKRKGYRFVRLDAIPQVACAMRVAALWSIVDHDGFALSASPSGNDVRLGPAGSPGPWSIFGGVPLGAGRWALRAAHGRFLGVRSDGRVVADAPSPGERGAFVFERRKRGVVLRTLDGRCLRREAAGSDFLLADASASDGLLTFRLIDATVAGPPHDEST